MKGVALYLGLLVAAAAMFLLLPQLDLWVSGLFYTPRYGFWLRDWAPIALMYHAVPWIVWGVVLVVATAGSWLFLMQRPLWRFDRKTVVFIVLSMVIGPGLIANTFLKDHWGRARPNQIAAFGGARGFSPAPLPAEECAYNCSFVSGHAALGFGLVAFAFVWPPGRARRRATAAAICVGALIGLVRIAQGGHFLSDVVWAGFIVFGTTAVLYRAVVEKDVFAAPAALHLYRAAAQSWRAGRLVLSRDEAARWAAAGIATAILAAVSIVFIDRPIAFYLHAESSGLHAFFLFLSSPGEAWGWLLLFALAFFFLHWGGELPRLREYAGSLRAFSAIPAFLFLAIAAAGLVVDLIKIGLGRMRPKLLFADHLYGFTWLAWRPDHWSFPSGHTATIGALMCALWWLWPQHLLFYVFAAAIVAGSRVLVGAHYPSDVVAGAFIAVAATRAVAWAFDAGGIDLMAARRGALDLAAAPPWPCRSLRRLAARRRAMR
jgi:lipid A 4'-phosphatase